MTLVIRFLHRIGSSITVDLMWALAVVKLYVCPDTFSEFSLGTVVIAIKLFRFERFEKCFHDRIIVGCAFTRERLRHSKRLATVNESPCRIVRSAITMEDQPLAWFAIFIRF